MIFGEWLLLLEEQSKRATIEKIGNEFFGRRNEAGAHMLNVLYWWAGDRTRVQRDELTRVFHDYLLDRGIESKVYQYLNYIFVQFKEDE